MVEVESLFIFLFMKGILLILESVENTENSKDFFFLKQKKSNFTLQTNLVLALG